MCTHVHQKPNHCVPACIESLAIDYGVEITQTEIVNKFPDVFPMGVLEDAGKPVTLKDVIKELGFAESIYDVPYSLDHLKNLSNENEILLIWTKKSNHCIRFCKFNKDYSKITVMDPETDKLQQHPTSWLDAVKPRLIYFKTEIAILLKNLTDALIKNLSLVSSVNSFNITYSEEFDCEDLPSFNKDVDITDNSKFKKIFNELDKIDKPVVYWFEIIFSSHSNEELFNKLKEYKLKKERNCTAVKNIANAETKILYVGSKEQNIYNRIEEHLGFANPDTGALQLCHWIKGSRVKLRLNIIQFPFNEISRKLIVRYEGKLAQKLKPLVGKHK